MEILDHLLSIQFTPHIIRIFYVGVHRGFKARVVTLVLCLDRGLGFGIATHYI